MTPERAAELLANSKPDAPKVIYDYRHGRDLTQISRGVFVIDADAFTAETLRDEHPAVYQHVLTTVKPERDQNREPYRKENWWKFGRSNASLRLALKNLPRFIATVETAKHRFFTFLDRSIGPDNMLVNIAVNDAQILGVLSSSIHVAWALSACGRLGFGNDPRYNKTRCFETFPFPDLPEANPLKATIRDLGEQLDAHRKRQQAAHADLTLTGLYNVVEKLRREEPLTDKDRKIHDHALAAVLKQLHDKLDTAVLAAYGWSDLATKVPLADRLARGDEVLEQAILTRLVALNHERAAEETSGKIRWLRPEYQNPAGTTSAKPDQPELEVETTAPVVTGKQPWPKTLPDKVSTLRSLLPTTGPDASALASHFGKRTKTRLTEITQILETLKDLGQL
ncbi:MAG: class I SAM-dependent DNA methyltransferase [Candidatus Synoicihabitans palmerolidicus]|nr:class I SAM-dependent DNA methyltransferase [Candidatus Synoicihabitans palmerolidicus]